MPIRTVIPRPAFKPRVCIWLNEAAAAVVTTEPYWPEVIAEPKSMVITFTTETGTLYFTALLIKFFSAARKPVLATGTVYEM